MTENQASRRHFFAVVLPSFGVAQPVVGIEGWWAVTTSTDVTRRKLIRSREGAMQLAQAWESAAG
jgi:hypothetical protein